MADYYTILKKTISGMAQNSQASRDAVYTKARSAIDRQLRAMNPTPSEEAIARQMTMLETAIVKLDGEFGAPPIGVGVDAPDAQIPVEQPHSVETTNPAPSPMTPEPSLGTPAPEPLVAPVSAPVVEPNTGYVPAGSSQTIHNPALDPALAGLGTVDAPAADPQGMDYSETILAQNPDTQPVEPGAKPKKKKSGFLSSLLPIILAIAVIGGGVYALWLNKDALINGLMGSDTPIVKTDDPSENSNGETANNDTTPVSPQPAKEVRVVGDETNEKSSVKLTTDGETVQVEPILVPTVSIPIQPDVETPVVPQPVTQPVEETSPPTNEEATSAAEPVVIAQNNETQPTPATPSNTAPAVAQKAFLYEEGASGANASRDNAAIIWSLGSQETDGVSEAVIMGKLDVPGRNLSMNIEIKRNRDDALPASHIIELVFSLPGDFSGGNISNVSRFVMKTSEQDRGSGLIAVPAKISDGNFLIALNNLDQALTTNRKLLLESSWIDVPLGYTTGRRALVTLEKGALGDKIFKEAFADWDKR